MKNVKGKCVGFSDFNVGETPAFPVRQDALSEIQAFLKRTGKIIRPITVQDILDEQVAHKLA